VPNNNEDKILMISYFYATKGCCPAEWADDKTNALSTIGKKIILLSSVFSIKSCDKNIVHYRVPSLSIVDLKHELHEIKINNLKMPWFSLIMLFPFIITLGLTLDLLQKFITSGNGGGKWSWTFPASVVALYLFFRHGCNLIFTTGGPAGAHLASVFVKLFTKKRLICELQDPLTGKDIGRTSRSALFLGYVEKIILNSADKVVYVTKDAAEYVKNRYKSVKADIVAIYPGSKSFEKENKISLNELNKKLTIIHLGTLYSTRNFYTLIEAIDCLIDENEISEEQIEILNLGEMYGDLKEHHLAKSYIRYETIKPREEAIKVASSFMVSLLVQHSDSRSNATIPYKTYDYINISNPILALTNSHELHEMLTSSGHISVNINNIANIKLALLNLLSNYENCKKNVNPLAIDILKQTADILK